MIVIDFFRRFVHVIARKGLKFEINFTSCSNNGNEIARGAAECYFAIIATTSGICIGNYMLLSGIWI